jgi:hypothetical protein
MVTPVVDGVTLRESPGTAGDRIGTLTRGSMNYVVDGPVDADGYTWYQLSGPGGYGSACVDPTLTDPLECTWFGWAAVGDPSDDSAWFAPTNVDCPDPAAETDAFFQLPQILLAACYGDDELTFEAFYEAPLGDDYHVDCTENVDAAVAWLYCIDIVYNQFRSSEGYGGFQTLYVDPASGVTLPQSGTCTDSPASGCQWMQITGAFDHPDAALCAAAVDEDPHAGADPNFNPDLAVLLCRTHFVISAAEETAAP